MAICCVAAAVLLRQLASILMQHESCGAGDYFCGAFLAAHLSGASVTTCAQAGCLAGTQAVQCEGAQLSDAAWLKLKTEFDALLADKEGGLQADGGAKVALVPVSHDAALQAST